MTWDPVYIQKTLLSSEAALIQHYYKETLHKVFHYFCCSLGMIELWPSFKFKLKKKKT